MTGHKRTINMRCSGLDIQNTQELALHIRRSEDILAHALCRSQNKLFTAPTRPRTTADTHTHEFGFPISLICDNNSRNGVSVGDLQTRRTHTLWWVYVGVLINMQVIRSVIMRRVRDRLAANTHRSCPDRQFWRQTIGCSRWIRACWWIPSLPSSWIS